MSGPSRRPERAWRAPPGDPFPCRSRRGAAPSCPWVRPCRGRAARRQGLRPTISSSGARARSPPEGMRSRREPSTPALRLLDERAFLIAIAACAAKRGGPELVGIQRTAPEQPEHALGSPPNSSGSRVALEAVVRDPAQRADARLVRQIVDQRGAARLGRDRPGRPRAAGNGAVLRARRRSPRSRTGAASARALRRRQRRQRGAGRTPPASCRARCASAASAWLTSPRVMPLSTSSSVWCTVICSVTRWSRSRCPLVVDSRASVMRGACASSSALRRYDISRLHDIS